jgi:hypothetical protein
MTGNPKILAIWSLMCPGTFHPKILHLVEFNFPLEAERKELKKRVNFLKAIGYNYRSRPQKKCII